MAITLTENYTATIVDDSKDPDLTMFTFSRATDETTTMTSGKGSNPGMVSCTNAANGTLIDFGDLALDGGPVWIENNTATDAVFGANNGGTLVEVGGIPANSFVKWYTSASGTLRIQSSGGAAIDICIRAAQA